MLGYKIGDKFYKCKTNEGTINDFWEPVVDKIRCCPICNYKTRYSLMLLRHFDHHFTKHIQIKNEKTKATEQI